jgi:hypothetical protein
MQCLKEKRTKGQTMIYKTQHRKQIEQHKPHIKRRAIIRRISISCFTSDTTRRLTLITNSSILRNYERMEL